MTAIAMHLSAVELETRYETAADAVSKSHFHAIWLLSLGHQWLRSFWRWVRLLRKRYNEHGPGSLGDRRQGNGSAPAILTPSRPRPMTAACGRGRKWRAGSPVSTPRAYRLKASNACPIFNIQRGNALFALARLAAR